MFALSSIVFAHGNQTQVMGKVTSISENSITVETTSKKTVTMSLSDSTKFQKSGFNGSLEGPESRGIKVVIHATGPEDKLGCH